MYLFESFVVASLKTYMYPNVTFHTNNTHTLLFINDIAYTLQMKANLDTLS